MMRESTMPSHTPWQPLHYPFSRSNEKAENSENLQLPIQKASSCKSDELVNAY